MHKSICLFFIIVFSYITFSFPEGKESKTNPPIYIAFLWHMHQPIYYPGETIIETDNNNRFPFSVKDIHNQRWGPYTSWPKNAVLKGINANLPHFGAQVSFSGSLIENLNVLESSGNSNFQNWKSHWNSIKTQKTSLNNPRLDMVAFGYFHPLMGLINDTDIKTQIKYHKDILSSQFPGSYSKGIFPPENAFSNRMIPSLLSEGIEWVLIDNIHFDRACKNYPFSTAGNIYEPNDADVINPNPNDWIQLNGLWAPTKNSAKWSRTPHYVEYINPETGLSSKIIAVPCDRYMGNEDGRGGFGALNYENVMSQLESYNTDPNHPILIVLHHDGDNYGGGSESYYNSNFQAFVNWLQANPSRFVCTTVQDYIQLFPPDPNDIIHIENGSWSGADNGDPEFKKWLGDPSNGYSPDINSWGVLTAAQNIVHTAQQINPNSPFTSQAWKFLLVGESSDYWYWDGSLNGIWDSNPTRAANLAVTAALMINGTDLTPPTIFIPQREPYNPGGTEWGVSQSNEPKIWSYVFDKSGLTSVKLKYRLDLDGQNSPLSAHNETFSGGSEVGDWISVDMNSSFIPAATSPLPLFKAKEYSFVITGLTNVLIDYYIEASDSNNNVARSPIQHCKIGQSGGGTTNYGVVWQPQNPTKNDTITITVTNSNKTAKLHWGVNNNGSNWQTPNNSYWIQGTTLFNGTGPAVESPFTGPDSAGNLIIKIGPFNNPVQSVSRIPFVIHYSDNTWNNNNGSDFLITLSDSGSGSSFSFVMDGILDAASIKAASNQNADFYIGWNGSELYTAANTSQSQNGDAFIFITDSLKNMVQAPWSKNGMVTQWSLFLANELDNNWSGWFDNIGVCNKAVGSVLEGTCNLQNEFGYLPQKIYAAVGYYNTSNNGSLLKQIPAGNGNNDIENIEFFQFNLVTTEVNSITESSKDFLLYDNYPNPFNPYTIISWQLFESSDVTLELYNLLGERIAVLLNEFQSSGRHNFRLNSSDYNLNTGVYFYRIKLKESIVTKKILLLK